MNHLIRQESVLLRPSTSVLLWPVFPLISPSSRNDFWQRVKEINFCEMKIVQDDGCCSAQLGICQIRKKYHRSKFLWFESQMSLKNCNLLIAKLLKKNPLSCLGPRTWRWEAGDPSQLSWHNSDVLEIKVVPPKLRIQISLKFCISVLPHAGFAGLARPVG